MQGVPSGAHALMLATALALAPSAASAQSWPSRFVTVVVAFPAGRPTDVLARAIVTELTDKLGQQFVVENRSGAGGNVGAASVAKAAADGYTLLFATTSVVNNRFMYKQRAIRCRSRLRPGPLDLQDADRAGGVAWRPAEAPRCADRPRQGQSRQAQFRLARPRHRRPYRRRIAAEARGFKLTHVPYRGSAPMIADLLGDQINIVSDLLPDPNSVAEGGQI